MLGVIEADARLKRRRRREHATPGTSPHGGLRAAGWEDARIVDAPNMFAAPVVLDNADELRIDPRLTGRRAPQRTPQARLSEAAQARSRLL
jgi:hypothetical protein